MLSKQTIEVIKSTVPVLEVHGTTITKRFYEMMFQNHPELLNIFNHANQKQERQQTALANAVYAAAKYIDNLEMILPVVKQVGHKHRSLGIKPEHYPIVGKHLLLAIEDVLGDSATDEIIQAWAEAYEVIAGAFIQVETNMYEEAEKQPGGWEGFRPFVVKRKQKESDVITSFYLAPQDGEAIADFEPGQYISVKMEIQGEVNTHIRQYSLSDAPGKSYYRISVKREDECGDRPAGKVSVYLHESVSEGDVLLLSAPAGHFTLNRKDDRPVVLISGGVGLTPMVSMLNTLAEMEPERSVTFIHAALNSQVHAMREHVTQLASENPNISVFYCYESPTAQDKVKNVYDKEGFIDESWLKKVIRTTDADFYFCGPTPFMKALNSGLKACGVSTEDIHYEFFGPAGTLEEVEPPRSERQVGAPQPV